MNLFLSWLFSSASRNGPADPSSVDVGAEIFHSLIQPVQSIMDSHGRSRGSDCGVGLHAK